MTTFLFREMMPFQDVPILGRLLSLGDVLFAAVLAFLLLLGLRVVQFFLRGVFRANPRPEDLAFILERCRTIFPIENIPFHDKMFTRGMKVRITTRTAKTVVGELVGMNNDHIVCVVSSTVIAADKLDMILTMEMVENEE